MAEQGIAYQTKTILLRGGPHNGLVIFRPTKIGPSDWGERPHAESSYQGTDEIVDGHQVCVFTGEKEAD